MLIVAGVALTGGAFWARIVAVIAASSSAIGQLILFPAQPWWSLIAIAVAVFIIYAVAVHGRAPVEAD